MTHLVHQAHLSIDFSGYWHAGSGRSSGHHLDAVCIRDAADLPFLPGRQLKGILRNALRRAEAWGWFTDIALPVGLAKTHEALLFGSASQEAERDSTFAGLLQVDSASLAAEESLFLQQPDNVVLRELLFDELYSTAIDEKSGTAKKYSLRGIEVCLPVQLYARLGLHVTALDPELRQQQQAWLAQANPWQALELALPLIDALGAHRNRGLGEAVLTLNTVALGA